MNYLTHWPVHHVTQWRREQIALKAWFPQLQTMVDRRRRSVQRPCTRLALPHGVQSWAIGRQWFKPHTR